MIIEFLANAMTTFMSLMLPMRIPTLPEDMMTYVEDFFGYICSGAEIVANYVPLPFVVPLFLIVVSVDVGITLYRFVMWIIKKIPLLGIK